MTLKRALVQQPDDIVIIHKKFEDLREEVYNTITPLEYMIKTDFAGILDVENR